MTSADIIANLWSSGNQSLWVRAKVQSGQCLAQNQKDIVLDTQDPCEKKTGMMVCAYNYSAGKEATGGSLGYFLARQPSLINKPRCCLKTTRKVPEEWQLGLSSVPHTRVHVNMDSPHKTVKCYSGQEVIPFIVTPTYWVLLVNWLSHLMLLS